MSHNIDLSSINLRTDLAIEEVVNKDSEESIIEEQIEDIKVTTVIINDDNKEKFMKKNGKYITIEFDDITDYNNSKKVEGVFINELKKVLDEYDIDDEKTCLVIGLGNEKSTPDSLGPISINDIVVTSHYFELGINVEEGFRSVSALSPGTMGQTGIETFDIVNSVVKEIKPDFVIVLDSLKASSINRINKTIQITDAGINPGSGIGNNRKELSKDVLNIPVFAIGVPTVVDTITIVNDSINQMTSYYSYMKNNMNNANEKLKIIRTNIPNDNIDEEDKKCLFGLIGSLKEDELKKYISEVLTPKGHNMIVTTKEIDFLIKKLSDLISSGINNTLHKNVTHL